MKKALSLLLGALLILSSPFVLAAGQADRPASPAGADAIAASASVLSDRYVIELARFGISNDGTNPQETTAGINEAIRWAQANGYTHVVLPAGTYLIAGGVKDADPDARINLVSNMTFELDRQAVIQKESNPWEIYDTIYIGPDVENVTVRGGTLRGDRDTHDYSRRGPNTSGTHEWGYGIQLAGAQNVVIENMTIERYTGDGIAIGGVTVGGNYLTGAYMESGGLDANGNPIAAAGKIRTVGRTQTNFDDPRYERYRTVHMWLPTGLSSTSYDICFYTSDHQLISCDKDRKIYSKGSIIPDGADYFRAVFDAESTANVRVNRMIIDNSRDVVVRYNDIGYNRRQGITAGGENVIILNNRIHNTSGVAPQSGIDIEPGFYPAIGHVIKGNHFYDNKIHIVLAYGEKVSVENNNFITLNTQGAVGVHVHEAYRGVKIKGNRFDGSSLTVRAEGTTLSGNAFTNSPITLSGRNITFDHASVIDSPLSFGQNPGVKVSNVVMTNTGKTANQKATLQVWEKPVEITNVTFQGVATANAISGTGSKDAIFRNLKMQPAERLSLPAGSYIGCSFESESAASLQVMYPNTVMEGCKFTNVTLYTYSSDNTLHIKDSTFVYSGDLKDPAIYAISTKQVTVENNRFYANRLTSVNHPIIKLGRYAWTNRPAEVLGGTVIGNEIRTNMKTVGIHTTEAGIGAPSYTVKDNVLVNAGLSLKASDNQSNNTLK